MAQVIQFPSDRERMARANIQKKLDGPDNGFYVAAMSDPASKRELIKSETERVHPMLPKVSRVKSHLYSAASYLGLID